MKSLQSRLSVWLLVSLAVVFAGQWLVVQYVVAKATERYMATRLGHDADQLLAALSFDAAGGLQMDTARMGGIYRRPFSGHYYLVTAGDDRRRSRSLWDVALVLPRPATGASRLMEKRGPRSQPLLVLVRGHEKQGRPVVVAVAEDLTPVRGELQRFRILYGLATLGVAVLLLLWQRHVVRRALGPLQRLRTELRELDEGGREALDPRGLPEEIRPLVTEVNHLLQTLRRRLIRSRESLGNLAHALKTPLTLLGQLVQERAGPEQAQWRGEAQGQLHNLQGLIDRELSRARLAGRAEPGRRFLAGRELPPLVDAMRHIHGDRAGGIDARYPADYRYDGDREDIIELLGNLLDNACKWARGRVIVRIDAGPGMHLTVEDDGPGCAPEALATLGRRGARLDEQQPGHGLGLAIARDIAEQYGGRIRFDRSDELGGLRVQVSLPPP